MLCHPSLCLCIERPQANTQNNKYFCRELGGGGNCRKLPGRPARRPDGRPARTSKTRWSYVCMHACMYVRTYVVVHEGQVASKVLRMGRRQVQLVYSEMELVCTYVCLHVCMYLCTCVHFYVCMYACPQTHDHRQRAPSREVHISLYLCMD